jgi:hemerythrin
MTEQHLMTEAHQGELMDGVHREFLMLLDRLGRADDAHELACADLLVSHCIEHFALEQQWMEETAMPGRELHVQDHEDLLSRLREAREAVAGGRSGAARAIVADLRGWFDRHGATRDEALAMQMQFAQHAKGRQGGPKVG